MLEVYSFAVVLGSSCRLQVLRKSEKAEGDIGLSPFSLKMSHKVSITLWSPAVVLSLGVFVSWFWVTPARDRSRRMKGIPRCLLLCLP
jgi:hypothetical protein